MSEIDKIIGEAVCDGWPRDADQYSEDQLLHLSTAIRAALLEKGYTIVSVAKLDDLRVSLKDAIKAIGGG